MSCRFCPLPFATGEGEGWGGVSFCPSFPTDRALMDELRQRARQLRNNATDAERHLWQHLRKHHLAGHRCRRQVPLAGYIADFACPALN